LQVSGDGRRFWSGQNNASTIELGDPASGKLVANLKHRFPLEGTSFTHDGKLLLMCNTWEHGNTSGVEVRDARSGKILHDWTVPAQWMAMAISPDDRTVALGGGDRLVTFWDLRTGKHKGASLLHPAAVYALTFSPNGRMLVSGTDYIPAARLWDLATHRAIGAPIPHRKQADRLAFHPNGKLLLTCDSSHTSAVIWEMPSPVRGSVEQVKTWVELLAGMEIDDRDMEKLLDGAGLQERRRRLAEFGGSPLATSARPGECVVNSRERK
jgi:WD40 repeat protein